MCASTYRITWLNIEFNACRPGSDNVSSYANVRLMYAALAKKNLENNPDHSSGRGWCRVEKGSYSSMSSTRSFELTVDKNPHVIITVA